MSNPKDLPQNALSNIVGKTITNFTPRISLNDKIHSDSEFDIHFTDGTSVSVMWRDRGLEVVFLHPRTPTSLTDDEMIDRMP
jgi:predicted metal-dependent peptidase